ncbi:hypothetical protein JOB18_047886 [Solea senegalensis]|uniref:Uncharacterized protein n=1 Tax=Solea senegalensis TaxID=28829 RepID=A0AAV6PF43_SOLSE|nr:hypothetical protein JOB18_047886 [Solea senegalensis]
MEGKSERGKKRETQIKEKTLENMEGKSERGEKRETKIKDEHMVTRSKVKVQKRQMKEEHLEKSERESEEGSSGAAQTLKMPLKRRKFQE